MIKPPFRIWIGGDKKRSAIVQTALFSIGFDWHSGNKTLDHLDKDALYIGTDGCICYGSTRGYFNDHEYKELPVEALMGAPINWKNRYEVE